MTVTHMSHRDAPVTVLGCHAAVTSPSVRSPRPDPTRPITTTGLSFSSMTSGRGWLATAATTARAVAGSVMDGGKPGCGGGW